jgi:non-specific serine/threonine protein kinase
LCRRRSPRFWGRTNSRSALWLSEPERALLRRLSVFAGGCSLESAEAVCAGEGIEEGEVLERLSSLVEKSLVVAEDPGKIEEMRYSLLETVRQYGQERLVEAGEAARVRRRHVERSLWLAERADAQIWSEDGPAWMERLEAEHDNLRAALGYGREIGDECEAGMRLAGALAQFWYMRGYWTEGREWLEGMLRQGHGRASVGRAKALLGAGILAWNQDDYRSARPWLEQSLALWRQLGCIRTQETKMKRYICSQSESC